jgi:hypothetical protein
MAILLVVSEFATASSAFVGMTGNTNTFAAAASFPAYPSTVTGDLPSFYHRLDEPVSSGVTPTTPDASVNNRTGNHSGATNGPELWYRFDEGSGTSTADDSGAGNTGTFVSGAAWAGSSGGHPGDAFSGNGSSNAVQASTAAVATNSAYSVCAWTRINSADDNATVVSQTSTNVAAFYLKFGVYGSGDYRWMFMLPKSDVANAVSTIAWTPANSASLNAWTHLCGVYDPAGSKLWIYLNGSATSIASSTVVTTAASGRTQVGRGEWNGGLVDYFPGRVDDVRLYQRALTNAEVNTIYNEGVDTEYSFDEASGNANDISGNGNTGTVVNSPTRIGGNYGNAINLNGTNQYVQSASSAVATNTSFSASAWVNLPAAAGTTNDRTVLSEDGSTVSRFYLKYENAPTDRWQLLMYDADSTATPRTVNSLNPPTTGTWSLLTMVYDDANDLMKLYVDGVLQGSTARTVDWNTTGGAYVGRDHGGNYFYGAVDDPQFYPYALTDMQVAALYGGVEPTTIPATAAQTGALQGAQQGQSTHTSMAFNGTGNGYNPFAYTDPDTFTIECWVKLADANGGQVIGFSKNTAAPAVANSFDRLVYIDSNQDLAFNVGATTMTYAATASTWTSWHHVAASLGTGGMKLYLDGNLVAGNSGITNGTNFTGYWRWAGGELTGLPNRPAHDYITGLIDEVAAYPNQLTDQAISWRYHSNH